MGVLVGAGVAEGTGVSKSDSNVAKRSGTLVGCSSSIIDCIKASTFIVGRGEAKPKGSAL